MAFLLLYLFVKSFHPTPWRDSISRPIAPITSVAGGETNGTTPRAAGAKGGEWLYFSA
jgi:hypothetical protein